jgi:hypothetical protein
MTHRIGFFTARGAAVSGLATLALVLAGLSAVPARADDHDDRGRWHERRWHRDHRPVEYYQQPDVYYAPPPVIYAPPGASLNLNFPLFR